VADITSDTVDTPEDAAVTFNVITGTNGARRHLRESGRRISAVNGTAIAIGQTVNVADGTVTLNRTAPSLQPDHELQRRRHLHLHRGLGRRGRDRIGDGHGRPGERSAGQHRAGPQSTPEDVDLVFSPAMAMRFSVIDVDFEPAER